MNSVNATFSAVLIAVVAILSLHRTLDSAPSGLWSMNWLGFHATLASTDTIPTIPAIDTVSATPAARHGASDSIEDDRYPLGVPPLRGTLETGGTQALALLTATINNTAPERPIAVETKTHALQEASTHGKLPDRVQPHRFVPSLAVLGEHQLADLFIAGRSNINVAIVEWDRIINSAGLTRQLDICEHDKGQCSTVRLGQWHQLLQEMRGKTRIEQLVMSNDFINSQPYLSDRELFGEDDYWTSLPEFLELSGDCEDFAIAKFFTLKRTGISNDDMRIIVVLDTARGLLHAVLAVTMGEQTIYLDSLSGEIHTDRSYAHYIPVYALNETDYWIY